MPKNILFVETMLDYATSVDFIENNPSATKDLLVVNLNAGNRMDYDSLGVEYKTETDYIREDTLDGINERALEIGRSWFLDPALKPVLEVDGSNVGLIWENFIVRRLITVSKYARLGRKILSEENCRDVAVIGHPEGLPAGASLLPSNDEKVFNDVLAVLAPVEGVRARTFASLPPVKPPASSWADAVKRLVEPLTDAARTLGNKIIRRRGFLAAERRVVFVGAPRLMFPLMEDFQRENSRVPMVYFQHVFGPRMVTRLLRRRIPYKITRDFPLKGEGSLRGELRRVLAQRCACLLDHPRFRQIMEFEGLDMVPALEKHLRYAFEECCVEILSAMRQYQRFLREEKIGAVVIDEAVKEFSRPFVLTAAARGIPSVEIQHGVPDYYVHHRLLTSKMACWGEYCKARYVEESRLNGQDIVVTGSPTLDRLKRLESHEAGPRVRRKLRVASSDRIVTFAATPFHLGSRGGIIGEHCTRDQLESVLGAILRALNGVEDIHLVVKLHHTDPHLCHVREFIRLRNFAQPNSVVKMFDIHSLMKSSDVILSMGSTAVLEAIVMETPVVLINFTGRPDAGPYARWGAVTAVRHEGDLRAAIEQVLSDREEVLRQTRPGRERVVRELACGADGHSGRRCVSLVEELLSRSLPLAKESVYF